jgi:ubiquinol-cytochrome c reductase cytochrome b subunit
LGVIAMFTAIFILLAMPILDTSRIRSSAFRPFMKFGFWLFVINFLVLLWVGSQHVEEPFITIGQFSTIFYFSYFLFLIPIIGLFENTLIDIALDKSPE